MPRVARLLVPLAAAAGLAVPMNAHATNTLTWTFAVPCTGAASTPTGFGLPTGVYAVTVAGACIVDLNNNPRTVGGTPCTVPVAGAVPCVDPVTVNGLTLFGQVTTGSGDDITTAPGATNYGCAVFSIRIDGNCFAAQAGTYNRTISGAMTVSFVDGNYADNLGELDVTVTWTPL
jgi:hypothetical protein